MDEIVGRVQSAFARRAHPGVSQITRCTYDKTNGGRFDGPCLECQEMAGFFGDKSWQELSAEDLRRHAQADVLFTVEAYCYFLPALLISALRAPDDLDVCVSHLVYRFGPKPDDDFGMARVAAILGELTGDELAVVLAYLNHSYSQEDDFEGYGERSIQHVESALRTSNRADT